MTTETEAPGAEVVHFKMASALDAVTHRVSEDEKCYMLAEMNLPSRSGKSLSRFQILRIVRGDQLVTAYVYLGPASSFHSDQLMAPGGQVVNGVGRAWHTVGELRDVADLMRSKPLRRELEPSDLQGAFRNQVEERKRLAAHRSTFGVKGALVRP